MEKFKNFLSSSPVGPRESVFQGPSVALDGPMTDAWS